MRKPRTHLVADLREHARGWWHLANDHLAEQARNAADLVERGEPSVRVGHTTYEVTD